MAQILLKPVFKEAWHKVAGTKQTFFITFMVLGLIQLAIVGIHAYLRTPFPDAHWVILLNAVLFSLGCIPVMTGLSMMGVKRAQGQKIHLKQGFMYFKKTGPLFLTGLMILLTLWLAGFIVSFLIIAFSSFFLSKTIMGTILGAMFGFTLILTFILTALFSFSLIQVADQNQSPWQAYKNSPKLVLPHFKTVVLALFICLLINLLAAIPLGIGFIWSLPFSQIVMGILYREISQFSKPF